MLRNFWKAKSDYRPEGPERLHALLLPHGFGAQAPSAPVPVAAVQIDEYGAPEGPVGRSDVLAEAAGDSLVRSERPEPGGLVIDERDSAVAHEDSNGVRRNGPPPELEESTTSGGAEPAREPDRATRHRSRLFT